MMETNETQQPKILVVDDNEQIRAILGMGLGAHHFQITTAANVSEALHLIDTDTFDVLLCDLQMPGAGDGFTGADHLKVETIQGARPSNLRTQFSAVHNSAVSRPRDTSDGVEEMK